MVLDLEKQDYRAADRKAADEVVEILKTKNPVAKFAALRESGHPQAQFLWSVFRDLFHYSAYHLADIAQTARDVDLARSEEQQSELPSLMRNSYAVFCLKKNKS